MHALIALLKRHEGLKLQPYRDTVGKLTIGYGRNLDDKGISQDEADYMLRNDIQEVIIQLYRALPWFGELNEVRQNVLISMAFNLGITGLLNFKLTLASISKGHYETASIQMLQSLWAKQVKGRAVELARMMKEGK